MIHNATEEPKIFSHPSLALLPPPYFQAQYAVYSINSIQTLLLHTLAGRSLSYRQLQYQYG